MKREVNQFDLLEEMIKGRDERLKIQATEYERRLEALNHENERVMEVLKQSIPREIFDRTLSELNNRLQILTDFKNAQQGRSQLMQYIPWVLTGISLIFMYLMYKK